MIVFYMELILLILYIKHKRALPTLLLQLQGSLTTMQLKPKSLDEAHVSVYRIFG